ncbi:cytochrome c oxidase assembly protein [Pullulanibacillus sp. KACC 23026]|uniref:cytochrome c oxidase assembly protein n=1 Tax=Pullulanibacillus sp. KACC 23026 TaxID=3028315 RepID=UPI0023B0F724|nr:cytochrome c oxidase assembly protein [Pullulanibacillus sp. KACC 23026]WEG10850.1 cytochrome c oxidase assembly protein [Pullulanibacillus sp. KACC 23026]
MPGMSMSVSPSHFWQLGFFELWHPVLFVILVAIGFVYIRTVQRHEKKPVITKTISFNLSLLMFYFSEGSPLSALGHHFLFSAHMLSMSVTYFIVPPLFLGGIYEWMIVPLVKRSAFKRFINFMTNPILAVSLFNLLLSFYHVPVIFNLIMSKMAYMNLSLVLLLFFAFVMWWPIVQPTLETRSLTELQKLGYVFVASILLTPACAMITFANSFLYLKTATEPTFFANFSPMEDQSTGGVVMKVTQELVFICTFAYIFFKWSKREKPELENDLNPKLTSIKQQLPSFRTK